MQEALKQRNGPVRCPLLLDHQLASAAAKPDRKIQVSETPADKRFRLGGMVEKGSVAKTPGTLDVKFLVTDFKHTVAVKYSGILPDLFRDGQGVIAHGRMQGNVFVADEILAKHDEKYMPPEVAKSLKDNPPPPPPGTGT